MSGNFFSDSPNLMLRFVPHVRNDFSPPPPRQAILKIYLEICTVFLILWISILLITVLQDYFKYIQYSMNPNYLWQTLDNREK